MKIQSIVSIICLSAIVVLSSCQKMEQPALGDYPKDVNPPGGPLKFFAAFDGTTDNPLMNAVDSVRANFPAENMLSSIDGVSGKALGGANKKYVRYAKPNDWAATAESFTISFWYKGDAQTKNNAGTNGTEYIMSLKAIKDYHWSGANLLLFLEGSNAACAVKLMIADSTKADHWFTWEGGNTIAGLLDNAWHHISLVYNAGTSTVTLYKDGVANSITQTWDNHGVINLDDAAIAQFRVGNGPGDAIDTDDWLSSSWKGGIDQLRLYSTALSAAEVTSLYTSKQ